MGLVLPQKIEVKRHKIYTDKGYKNDSPTIMVNVLDLPYRSKVVVKIICDYCGEEKQIMYRDYYRANNGSVVNKIACYDKDCKYEKQSEFMGIVATKEYGIKDNSHRDRDWLYNEYIVKNRDAIDIAKQCGINLRTMRHWINKHGLIEKNEKNTIKIDREVICDLYINQQKTTMEIAEIYNCNDVTISKILKQYNIPTYSKSYTFKRYYSDKGGLDRIIKFSRKMENRIRQSCKARGIDVSEFNGFAIKGNAQIRTSFEYVDWRKAVFKRDNYTCQCCGERGGLLNAHHKENFSSNEGLRFDIDNGITLCFDCHSTKSERGFHRLYGTYKNNEQQLNEYIENYKKQKTG